MTLTFLVAQTPGDALPIAYTINCDESWDGDDLNESCAQVPRWLHADDYVPDTPGTNRATYLLIRNMRGDLQAPATTDGCTGGCQRCGFLHRCVLRGLALRQHRGDSKRSLRLRHQRHDLALEFSNGFEGSELHQPVGC